ncbi:MAG: CDGSH iron-sulfur domain-containing protein [Steroidobacteraceae bacterium]|nr:CDGSH iron-sulfur domain-containing protein [Steroidobacteraceae bacterium]
MTQGHIAGTAPLAIDVEAQKTYYWCSCGQSKNQPFCDGSHKGSTFEPLAWTATKTERKYFCACKQTHTAPFCDGTHKSLTP